jgi:hypothetical protein
VNAVINQATWDLLRPLLIFKTIDHVFRAYRFHRWTKNLINMYRVHSELFHQEFTNCGPYPYVINVMLSDKRTVICLSTYEVLKIGCMYDVAPCAQSNRSIHRTRHCVMHRKTVSFECKVWEGTSVKWECCGRKSCWYIFRYCLIICIQKVMKFRQPQSEELNWEEEAETTNVNLGISALILQEVHEYA